MSPTPITPQDLLTMGAAGVVVGVALDRVLLHLCAWLRTRRTRALLENSTLFKYQP